MNRSNTDRQHHPLDHTSKTGRLSRRRLLVTGTGALAGALPVLAAAEPFAATGVAAEVATERVAAIGVAAEAAVEHTAPIAVTMERATDRQQRIAAILERHGPELGSGR